MHTPSIDNFGSSTKGGILVSTNILFNAFYKLAYLSSVTLGKLETLIYYYHLLILIVLVYNLYCGLLS